MNVCGLVQLSFPGVDVSAQSTGVFMEFNSNNHILYSRSYYEQARGGGGNRGTKKLVPLAVLFQDVLQDLAKLYIFFADIFQEPRKNRFILTVFFQDFNVSYKNLSRTA